MLTIEEKIELNKKVRSYNGKNTFVISLQKQLKNSKTLEKVDNGKGKLVKILSDKQYAVAKSILDKVD